MANDPRTNTPPAADETAAPERNGGSSSEYWFVTIAEGKEITVTDADQLHPLEQPNDPNSLTADGKPVKGKELAKADKDGRIQEGYYPSHAWAQRTSDKGAVEVVIIPGRVVLVYPSAGIRHKLQVNELVRVDKSGKSF